MRATEVAAHRDDRLSKRRTGHLQDIIFVGRRRAFVARGAVRGERRGPDERDNDRIPRSSHRVTVGDGPEGALPARCAVGSALERKLAERSEGLLREYNDCGSGEAGSHRRKTVLA